MPLRAKRPCAGAGCRDVASGGRFCAKCAVDKAVTRPYDRWRGSSASRGYDAAWRRVRLQALERDHFLCQDCLLRKILTPAEEVHHLIEIDIAPHLRLELDNLLSLCKPCHSSRTARVSIAVPKRNP